MNKTFFLLFILLASACLSTASAETKLVSIDKSWAKNSVNANILRHNSVTTHENDQYVAYYDAERFVILASERLNLSRGK